MSEKTDWYSIKYKKPKQRNPYSKPTEAHRDRKKYDRTKDKQKIKNLIKDYM